MIFSRLFNNISRHHREQIIQLKLKRSAFRLARSNFNNYKCGNMKEQNNIVMENATPLYKSYKGHDLKIEYENDFFLVVNKPYDIKLEKGKLDDIYPSVETLLRKKRNLNTFRMCGQLDYATSGLLIIAKDKLSSNILNYNIESKNISKIYLAILYGHLPLDVLHINVPISKVKNEFKMKLCYNYNDYYDTGKYCYSLIYPYKHTYLENEKVTLCELRTITGRRHQLRLHSICLGSGIVGDETYFEDMIENKYKINYINSSGKNITNNDNSTGCVNNKNNGTSIEGINNEKFNVEKYVKKRIDAERMMLHCWIIIKNENIKVENKLNKSENINNLEQKIFDKDYIICDDVLSEFVNEKPRTFDDCFLKNNYLINQNFINYNVKNINKNLQKVDRKLKKEKYTYDALLHNSLILENSRQDKSEGFVKEGKNFQANQIDMQCRKSENCKAEIIVENFEKFEKKSNEENSIDLKPENIEQVDVTETFINNKVIDKNNIYSVKNDKYQNPNDLFDDIHDSVNKFNWG
ncbi:ribosomal large subunit pseudouridylate synthase, putative [Plasmodium vinckei brucechwatti]|uniref:Ribosomal large subunit pseudouridylate synthase, putative n=1 Tax=Plasmodium vinckei brucechwatti TaxID=119398 RepID=A0A6V7SL04_PLAVN|nr:ribosomal large subunit pseudouridylate synthase, putative [Plasmodium vinckei brucechwatti]